MSLPPSTHEISAARRGAADASLKQSFDESICTAIGSAVNWGKISRQTAIDGGRILEGEFDLPGAILARYEIKPSHRMWGDATALLVINPTSDRYPLPPHIMLPRKQGEGMAMVHVLWGDVVAPHVSLYYTSVGLKRRWAAIS